MTARALTVAEARVRRSGPKTRVDWAAAAADYEGGLTTTEVATKYGIDASNVSRQLRAHGVKMRPPNQRRVRLDDDAAVALLAMPGARAARVARHLGVSGYVIRRLQLERGLLAAPVGAPTLDAPALSESDRWNGTARRKRSTRICMVDDCGEDHHGKGYCRVHYLRVFHLSGTTELTPKPTNTFVSNGDGTSTILARASGGIVIRGLVDETDVPMLSNYLWFPQVSEGSLTMYLKADTREGRRSSRSILMHQLVLGASGVDHRNRNGLDNRRSNLRPATPAQNNANKASRQGAKSSYKGVFEAWRPGKWVASIQVQGKKRYLGSFDDEVAAAKAYDIAASNAWGDFAYLNFPGELLSATTSLGDVTE